MAPKKRKSRNRGHRKPLTLNRARSKAAFGQRGHRPPPLKAFEGKHDQMRTWLSARSDPFSRRLAKLVSTRRDGDRLVLTSGLSQESHAELTRLAAEAVAGLQEELRSLSDRIRALLQEGDPAFLISWVSFWHTFGLEGTYFEPTHHGLEAAVEFTAGLAAGLRTKEGMAPDPAGAQELVGLLDEIFELAKLLLVAESQQGASPIQDELRYRSRLHSLLVRGDAYVDQGEQLARSLFEPEAEWMNRDLGFTVFDVIELEKSLTSLLQRRVSDLLTSVADQSAQFDAFLRDRNAPVTVRQAMTKLGKKGLKEHFFIERLADGIVDALSFSIEDVVDESSEIDREATQKVLSAFAIGGGDASYWSPLQRSPLLSGPIVPVGDRFLAPVMGLLRRDLTELLERLVLSHRPKFPARRAKTLDRLAVECLEGVFPGARTYVSAYYPIEGDDRAARAEADGLVLWNDVCFVLEGKGKPLSPQGKRGDVKRIQADLQASLAEAWNQGNRVIEYLQRARPAVFYDDRGAELCSVDGSSIVYAKVITPTIHTLADHALHLEQFADIGLDVSGQPPWAVSINDLRMICELVRSPAELICYVRWRDRLHLGRASIAADEADVFGAFLLRQPYAYQAASAGTLHIGSHSTDFDAYYMSERRGSEANKPGMFSIQLVDGFVDRLVNERPDGWLDAADVVLTLSLEQLAFVDHAAPLLARAAAAEDRVVSHAEFGATVLGLPSSQAMRQPAGSGASGPHVYVEIQRGSPKVIWASSDG